MRVKEIPSTRQPSGARSAKAERTVSSSMASATSRIRPHPRQTAWERGCPIRTDAEPSLGRGMLPGTTGASRPRDFRRGPSGAPAPGRRRRRAPLGRGRDVRGDGAAGRAERVRAIRCPPAHPYKRRRGPETGARSRAYAATALFRGGEVDRVRCTNRLQIRALCPRRAGSPSRATSGGMPIGSSSNVSRPAPRGGPVGAPTLRVSPQVHVQEEDRRQQDSHRFREDRFGRDEEPEDLGRVGARDPPVKKDRIRCGDPGGADRVGEEIPRRREDLAKGRHLGEPPLPGLRRGGHGSDFRSTPPISIGGR